MSHLAAASVRGARLEVAEDLLDLRRVVSGGCSLEPLPDVLGGQLEAVIAVCDLLTQLRRVSRRAQPLHVRVEPRHLGLQLEHGGDEVAGGLRAQQCAVTFDRLCAGSSPRRTASSQADMLTCTES